MNGGFLKKVEDMHAEYRREDLGKGVRGKHHAAYQKDYNLVLLTPELEKIFPTNKTVNAALESLVSDTGGGVICNSPSTPLVPFSEVKNNAQTQ